MRNKARKWVKEMKGKENLGWEKGEGKGKEKGNGKDGGTVNFEYLPSFHHWPCTIKIPTHWPLSPNNHLFIRFITQWPAIISVTKTTVTLSKQNKTSKHDGPLLPRLMFPKCVNTIWHCFLDKKDVFFSPEKFKNHNQVFIVIIDCKAVRQHRIVTTDLSKTQRCADNEDLHQNVFESL